MSFKTLKNTKKTSLIQATSNTTVKVAGFVSYSDIGYSETEVTDAYITQISTGSPSFEAGYWEIKRGSNTVAILDSFSILDLRDLPIRLDSSADLTATPMNSSSGSILIELGKRFNNVSDPEFGLILHVRDAGGTSSPSVTKSGDTAVWEALEGGVVVATYTSNAPSHTFAAGSGNAWRLRYDVDLTTITALNCSSDLLVGALDVSACTALVTLYCYSNSLTSLDVSTNTALVTLQCYSNSLTALDVSTNTALVELLCDDNAITNQTIIDAIYADLATAGLNNGSVSTSGGTNADPTDGLLNTNIVTLQSRGWTVTI